MSWRSKGDQVVPEEAPAPTADDDVLAQRLAELTHREVALRRITEVVEKQRTGLEERERALASSTSAAVADAERRLADAEQRLAGAEQRLAEATGRAEQAEQRVRELEQRVQELDQHVSELEERPEPQAAAPAVEAAPQARAIDPDAADAPYTLQRLERLVHDAQLRGDPQAEEWAYYLPLLREHAEPDGRLPAQFASLVDSIFAA
jgi:DNA repair exonuclease SbcCD ATPase subunit